MKVLIACEFSGTVRRAFRELGHDAWSCDLLPAEDGSPHHIQDDCLKHLNEDWDMMIAHPPCTYLCSSGLHWNKRRPERALQTAAALTFVRALLNAPIPMIALENPIGCISSQLRKPNQTIQPWQFGHPESKATCLWLKGLPLLRPTNILHTGPAWIKCPDCDDYFCTLHTEHVADCTCPDIDTWAKRDIDPYTTGGRWDNQTPSGQNKLGPSANRWKIRSLTYPGVAAAMAAQWGGVR